MPDDALQKRAIRNSQLPDAAYTNDRCPLCEGKGNQYFEYSGEYGIFHIDECPACDFIYVREIPSKSSLRETYHLHGGTTDTFKPDNKIHKKFKNWFFVKRLRTIAGNKRRRVLEVGYAKGNLLRAMKREGTFEAEGIDLSHGPYEYLKSCGLNVSISSIEDMKFPNGKFDIIVGLHVIEHLHDPRQFVKEVHRVLSERGRLYLQMPTPAHWRARLAGRNWKHYAPPFHLWYFAPKSIRRLLTTGGFRVLSAHCLSNRTHLTVVAERV